MGSDDAGYIVDIGWQDIYRATDTAKTIVVSGDASDTLNVANADWAFIGSEALNGVTYNRYTSGNVILAVNAAITTSIASIVAAVVGTLSNDALAGVDNGDEVFFATSGQDTISVGAAGYAGLDTLHISSAFEFMGASFDGVDLGIYYQDRFDHTQLHSATIIGHATVNSLDLIEFDADGDGIVESMTVAAIAGDHLTAWGDGLDRLVVATDAANIINIGEFDGFVAIFAGAGDDQITIHANHLAGAFIDGGEGNDFITGGGGADEIFFGSGDDTFDAVNGGGDRVELSDELELDGMYRDTSEAGFAPAVFTFVDQNATNHSIKINNDADNVEVEFNFEGTLSTFILSSDVDGTGLTSNALVLGGDELNSSSVIGSDHDDIVAGSYGGGAISGGLGNDTLLVTTMDNTDTSIFNAIDGGIGIDTVDFSFLSHGVVVDLASGIATGGLGSGRNLNAIENVVGTESVDTFTGVAGANVFEGGGGSDRFIYTSTSDSDNFENNGFDTIRDFDAGSAGTAVDLIDISAIYSSIGGTQFSFLGVDVDLAASAGASGQVRAAFNSQTKRLEIDTDTTAGANMEIELQNNDGSGLGDEDFITSI